MRRAHTVEQVRAAEAALMAELPAGTLMDRATTGLAVAISNFLGFTYGARVVLLVGAGDNGGDALYAGAKLARRGAKVTAVLLSEKHHRDGLEALLAAGGRVAAGAGAGGAPGFAGDEPSFARVIVGADVVVDGIVGIGGRPGLRGRALAAVRVVEEHGVPIVAVDMPSGVDVDTGETPAEHVKAALTVTFGTHKICHLVDPAAAACGPVHLVDIGLDLPPASVESLQIADVRALYPIPHGESDKYSRGVLGLRVGSTRYAGAAVMVAGGALGGPLGMARYVGPPAVADAVRAAYPEVMAGDGRVQAWVIGSGLGEEDAAGSLDSVLTGDLPVLVDAESLSALPERFGIPALLTPHAGELGRMLGLERHEIEAKRLRYTRQAAERYNATVLLKGATTVIASPDGKAQVSGNATPWLATAGAGDVLAGLCGALLAAGLAPYEAAGVGAFLHSAAAVLASDGAPITAGAVAQSLPEVTRRILE